MCEQNLILIRHTDDAQGVFAHECCHVLVYDHFTAADKDVLKSGWRQRMKRGKAVSGYAKTNWEEGTAEAFRCYVGAAAKPQQSADELFRYFDGN